MRWDKCEHNHHVLVSAFLWNTREHVFIPYRVLYTCARLHAEHEKDKAAKERPPLLGQDGGWEQSELRWQAAHSHILLCWRTRPQRTPLIGCRAGINTALAHGGCWLAAADVRQFKQRAPWAGGKRRLRITDAEPRCRVSLRSDMLPFTVCWRAHALFHFYRHDVRQPLNVHRGLTVRRRSRALCMAASYRYYSQPGTGGWSSSRTEPGVPAASLLPPRFDSEFRSDWKTR